MSIQRKRKGIEEGETQDAWKAQVQVDTGFTSVSHLSSKYLNV